MSQGVTMSDRSLAAASGSEVPGAAATGSGDEVPGATASPPTERGPLAALPWLIRLRWAAVVALVLVAWVGSLVLDLELRLWRVTILVLAMAITNAWLAGWHRSGRGERRVVGGVLVLDIFLLTGILLLTGGPTNPFSVIYLVHITLAAVVLGTAWTWSVAALSIVCYAALFQWHIPADDLIPNHLAGMWVAFAAAAAFIAGFLPQVSAALERRDRELAEARALAARHERLAALTTLAAGAAHELATPLGTIAVAAGELDRAARQLTPGEHGPIVDDVQLIRAEVERCRTILDSMSGRARGRRADDEPLELARALDEVRAKLPEAERRRVQVRCRQRRVHLRVQHGEFVTIVWSLVRNALEAGPSSRVTVTAADRDGTIRVRVRDDGRGMDPAVLRRAGEPFFTTKAPGQGFGLGLFLARTFAERLGGALGVTSTAGCGTVVSMVLRSGEPAHESA